MIQDISDESFFAKPLDFVEPLHLKPWKSYFLTSLSALITIISFTHSQLSIMSWLAIIPFWLGLRGRKDKGVFWLGFIYGLILHTTPLLWSSSLEVKTYLLTAILWASLFGFWAWFSRKMYFYLAFPKVTSTIADAPRQQFILTWQKLLMLCLMSSFIWTFFEWIGGIAFGNIYWNSFGLAQGQNSSLLPIASFTGTPGISFLVILCNMSLALSLETKLIDQKHPFPWSVPVICLIFTGLTITSATKFTVQNKPDTLVQISKVKDSLNTVNALGLKTLNDYVILGVSKGADVNSSKICRQLIRSGANLLASHNLEKIPMVKNQIIFRAVENSLPIIAYSSAKKSYLILPNGKTSETTEQLTLTQNFKPSFYYRNPNFFTNIVIIATFIAFLATGLHFYKRKTILRDLISGKD